jgi:hypothetical protein
MTSLEEATFVALFVVDPLVARLSFSRRAKLAFDCFEENAIAGRILPAITSPSLQESYAKHAALVPSFRRGQFGSVMCCLIAPSISIFSGGEPIGKFAPGFGIQSRVDVTEGRG